jgi:hypothetical protein
MDLELILKYLGRDPTYREQQAIQILISMMREGWQNMEAERFEVHQELKRIDAKIESLSFAEFVATYQENVGG